VGNIRTNAAPVAHVAKASLKKMRKDTAEYINVLMRAFLSQLSELSTGAVKEKCSADEAKAYLMPVSQIIALSFDVLDLIFKQYRELMPTE
jgi:hypothetical protein